MQIKYQDRTTGLITIAAFDRHTMTRTMRRYPSRRYEYVEGDFTPRTVQLVGMRRQRQQVII